MHSGSATSGAACRLLVGRWLPCNHLPPSRYYPLLRRRPNDDLVDEVLEVVPAGPAGLATPVVARPMPRPQPKIKAHIKDILTLFPEGVMRLLAGPWGSVGPRAVVGKKPAAAER